MSWISMRVIWKSIKSSAKHAFNCKSVRVWVEPRATDKELTRREIVREWTNPIHWLMWLGDFVASWLRTRLSTRLVICIPAFFVPFACGFYYFQTSWVRADWRSEHYLDTLAAYGGEGNEAEARIALLHLIGRYPEESRYRYQLALLEEKLNNEEAAARLMWLQASTKSYPPAAWWLLSRRFPLSKIDSWSPEEHLRFRRLAAIAVEGSDYGFDVPARKMLGIYLASQGSLEESAAQIESIVTKDRECLLILAQVFIQMGDGVKAKQWAERAESYYREKLKADPESKADRVNIAKTYLILAREEDAVRALNEGYKLTSDESLKQAGGEAIAAWANRIEQSEPATDSNLIRRLQLLKRAVQLAPDNPIVLDSLLKTLIKSANNSNVDIKAVQQAIIDGMSPEHMHFVLGTVALLNGNMRDAELHLNIAAKSESNLAGVLNNMAVVLTEKQPPELDTALQLVQEALRRAPDYTYFHETRGQIYLRLQRYEDAIADLEYAMRSPELRPAIHRGLADAYAALGQAELAKKHQSQADKPTSRPR